MAICSLGTETSIAAVICQSTFIFSQHPAKILHNNPSSNVGYSEAISTRCQLKKSTGEATKTLKLEDQVSLSCYEDINEEGATSLIHPEFVDPPLDILTHPDHSWGAHDGRCVFVDILC